MNRLLAIVGVALSSLALCACGGSSKGTPLGGGSQGAAQAMYQAVQPLILAGTPPSGGGTVTVKGAHGGTALLTYTPSTSGGPNSDYVTVAYSNFNFDGTDVYNGTLAAGLQFTSSTNFQVELEGLLDITGPVADSLSITVTQTVSPASSGTTVGLTGHINTSTTAYNYSNQNFSFSGSDALPKT